MHKKTLLLVSGLLVLVGQSQVDTTVFHRIQEEGLQHSQIPQLAHYLTDVNGPRLTNSPGFRTAVRWAVNTFKGWDIKAGPEPWGEYGKGWSNETAEISWQKPYYEPITGYAMPWTTGTDGPVTAGVAMIDGFDSASIDKAGESLRGKIVIVRKKDTLVPPLFEGDAYRYADSELATIKDHSMINAATVAAMKGRLLAQYNTRLYLASKGAVALLNGRGRDGSVFISSYLGYAKQYPSTMPEMVVNLESYLKLQRMLVYGDTPTL